GRAHMVAGCAVAAAVISQDEQGPLGHDDVEGHLGRAVALIEKCRLVDRSAVHFESPLLVAADHVVSLYPDDAFDVVRVPEITGAVEDDDIAPLRLGTETVRQLVY